MSAYRPKTYTDRRIFVARADCSDVVQREDGHFLTVDAYPPTVRKQDAREYGAMFSLKGEPPTYHPLHGNFTPGKVNEFDKVVRLVEPRV